MPKPTSLLLTQFESEAKSTNKKEKLTNAFDQDYRRVNDLEHDLIETIKYEAKIFTEPR